MLISRIINRLDEFKTQGDTTAQQVAGVRGDLEAVMSKVNQNFKSMASNIDLQHRVINSVGQSLDDTKKDQREL